MSPMRVATGRSPLTYSIRSIMDGEMSSAVTGTPLSASNSATRPVPTPRSRAGPGKAGEELRGGARVAQAEHPVIVVCPGVPPARLLRVDGQLWD